MHSSPDSVSAIIPARNERDTIARAVLSLSRQPEIADHLQHVYFRLQQADFFSRTSRDPDGKELSLMARKFYEESQKQFEAGNWFGADEYAKSADDLLRGLENLAQAAAPGPSLPPRPR